MARLVSLVIVTVLMVFLGITFYKVIAPFLLPLFLAGVVTILCQPLFKYFVGRTKGRHRLAAGLTTGSIMAIILVPLVLGIFIGSVQLYTLAQYTLDNRNFHRYAEKVNAQLEADVLWRRAYEILPADVLPAPTEDHEKQFREQVEQLRHNIQTQLHSLAARSLGIAAQQGFGVASNFLGSMLSGIIGLMMFTIALYYFLADGPALISAAEGLIPVHAPYQRQLMQQFERVIRAVVVATFLAAIGQSAVTTFTLYIVGFHHFILIFIVATLAALIPLAGTWLIWGPCAIWLAYQGEWGKAIFLTFVGSIIVGMLDNVIRTYVLQSDAKLHPLLAFVSVLGGLQVMGLWGVFIGPIVASFLHALIQIFNTELKELSKHRAAIAEKTDSAEPAPAESNALRDKDNGDDTADETVSSKKKTARSKPNKKRKTASKPRKTRRKKPAAKKTKRRPHKS